MPARQRSRPTPAPRSPEGPQGRPAERSPGKAPPPEAPPAKVPRKRAPKKAPGPPAQVPAKDEEPTLGLEEPPAPALEFSQTAPTRRRPWTPSPPTAPRALIVTAYIGIGNRLFIRGEGAGLSWDRGTPLQFVSIGKWRWEALDVTAPVTYKLYKNDELECAALGALTVEPGHQQEITATF